MCSIKVLDFYEQEPTCMQLSHSCNRLVNDWQTCVSNLAVDFNHRMWHDCIPKTMWYYVEHKVAAEMHVWNSTNNKDELTPVAAPEFQWWFALKSRSSSTIYDIIMNYIMIRNTAHVLIYKHSATMCVRFNFHSLSASCTTHWPKVIHHGCTLQTLL